MMRAYEMMIILDGDLEESAAHDWLRTVTDAVTKAGGSVHGKPDWWGRRQFAYPINKKEFGYYAVFHVLAPAGALDDFERSLRIADDVVRHKLLRLPDAEAARRGMAA
jgi:small subunit ribosomal protein S6